MGTRQAADNAGGEPMRPSEKALYLCIASDDT